MTEKEKRENEALKNCIQEAYGLSDEQLLAELEELEATLSDDEFVGAEERIYNRIKEREAERSSDSSEETADTSKASNSNPAPIRKISKKKRWLVVGIAAALVVGAGVNTIGGNHYFLRRDESKEEIVFDGGQNIIKTGDLEEAYIEVERILETPILKLYYIPEGMEFKNLIIADNYAILTFLYDNNIIYYSQYHRSEEMSLGISSDRTDQGERVFNKWIEKEIEIEKNMLTNKVMEYSAVINMKDVNYRIVGILPEEELVKILSRISY